MKTTTVIVFYFCLSCCVLLLFLVKVGSVELRRDSHHSGSAQDSPATKKYDCPVESACDDLLGFEAILILHKRLDDDADGNIDIVESDDFLRDELNYKSGYERQKRFHRNDKQISVDELWTSWKSSEVHNWTMEETVQWLIISVELPQYINNFEKNSIDGTSLPRLAVNNMHFLSNMGIKDPIHKHKISLKAMDVVLFGPPRNHNYFKDIVLALSVCLATAGCWFAFVQHKKSQSHLKKTMKDMESLQRAEEALKKLQQELDKAKVEQEIVQTEKKRLESRLQSEKLSTKMKSQDSSGSLDEHNKIQKLEEELKDVIEELHSTERALQAKNWIPSPALQHWLQLTYELELQHYNDKKAAVEKQLLAAKEGCEKLRKKRTSFMGSFRVAHGNAINDVDTRILQAKGALSEVTKDLQERQSRWNEIETLCGFSIVQNLGIRYLESMLGTATQVPASTSVTPRAIRRNSEGALTEDDTTPIIDSNVSARSISNIPVYCNQRSGFNVSLGTVRNFPSSDIKAVASSSAILQRPSVFHLDSPSDLNFLESKENAASGSMRAVFTFGESKDSNFPSAESTP